MGRIAFMLDGFAYKGNFGSFFFQMLAHCCYHVVNHRNNYTDKFASLIGELGWAEGMRQAGRGSGCWPRGTESVHTSERKGILVYPPVTQLRGNHAHFHMVLPPV